MNNLYCEYCKLNYHLDLEIPNSAFLLFQGLRCHSFVILQNHKLPTNILEKIYKDWKFFFKSDNKYNWMRSDLYDEGYVPLHTEIAQGSADPDNKEFYESHYKGVYPSCIDLTSTLEFLDAYVKLTEKLLFFIDNKLPFFVRKKMRKSLIEMISGSNNHMIRIIHYPPISKEMITERASAHGDACLFTILPIATSEGLEFLGRNGSWFAPSITGSDVVFFNSDMIELCTDGYLKSAHHRVTCAKSGFLHARYSIPFFIHPKRNIVLKKNLTAFEFLQKRLTEIGYDGAKLINTDQ